LSYNHYSSFQDIFIDEKNIVYEDFAKEPSLNNKCNFTSMGFENSLFIYKSDFLFNENFTKVCSSNIDGISFNFKLEGEIQYESLLSNEKHTIKENSTTINITSKENGFHTIAKNKDYKAVNIIMKKDFLEKVLPNSMFKDEVYSSLEQEYFFKTIQSKTTDLKSKLLVYELYNSPYNGKLDYLYIYSKLLELVYSELNNLSNQKSIIDQKAIKFSQYDIDALHKAKEILINNMQTPPSIKELSKIVKLNEFKLKIGFKKLFNITPYALLYEYKMEKAKELLESSEYSVNEVSQIVGYKQQQNFRTAFVKKFGILPKDIMKSRKYYY